MKKKNENLTPILFGGVCLLFTFLFLYFLLNSTDKVYSADRSYEFFRNSQVHELKTEEEYFTFVEKNPKTMLVFYAKWCNFSKNLDMRIQEIQEKSGFHVLYIDIEKFPNLMKHYEITSTPTVVRHLNEEEKPVGFAGARSTEEILYFLENGKLKSPETDSLSNELSIPVDKNK